MRKPGFCICERKGADQPYGNRAADQGLYFHYIYSTILLKISNHLLWPHSLVCLTWSETPKTGFLMTWLNVCLFQGYDLIGRSGLFCFVL